MRTIVAMSIALLVVFVAGVQPAAAEKPTGTPVVRMPLGKEGHGLNAPGVKVSTYGHGKIVFGDLGLSVTDVAVSGVDRGTLILRDGLKVRRGKRSVTIKGLFVVVDRGRVKITGRVLGRRILIASGRGSANQVISGRIAVDLSVKRLTLSRELTSALKRGLRTFKPRTRAMGALLGGAYVVAPPVDSGPTVDLNSAYGCTPVGGPSSDPTKPGGAIDLTCGYVIWNVRDGWITYIESSAVAPAAVLPAIPGNQHVCPTKGVPDVKSYSYRLPIRSGWWDAASSTGSIVTDGGMHFVNTAHGIDIKLTEVEIRFSAGTSQVSAFDIDPSHPSGARIPLVTVNPGTPRAGGPLAPGTKMTRLDTALTAEGNDLIGHGIYEVGGPFGCLDVGFNF